MNKTENIIGNIVEKYNDSFYVVFRIFVGLLFFQHGAQKLLGWFGATAPVDIFSLMGLAGTIEFFGGLAIAIGLFTRLSALGGIFLMISAYFMAHIPQGLIPIMNKGELALLYLACFLVILVYGSRKLSVEKTLFKKELF